MAETVESENIMVANMAKNQLFEGTKFSFNFFFVFFVNVFFFFGKSFVNDERECTRRTQVSFGVAGRLLRRLSGIRSCQSTSLGRSVCNIDGLLLHKMFVVFENERK